MRSPVFGFLPQLVLGLLSTSVVIAGVAARDSRAIYAESCASCHGADLRGGSGSALLGPTWKHGGDEETLAAGIRDGYPDAGMPAFGSALSENEIRSLVVYIREQAGREAVRREAPARPSFSGSTNSKLHSFRLESVMEGLKEPWSLAFLPDGRTLITEKRGELRVFTEGQSSATPVTRVPAVDTANQAGLFDVVPHPRFSQNGWIYLAYAEPWTNDRGESRSFTTIMRGRLDNDSLIDQQVIFRAPYDAFKKSGGVHFAGRIAFDANGYLFFSIGDRGTPSDSLKLGMPNGKIHRLHDDGSIPTDNPFAGTPGAASVWSYGHRNPHGLRFHPVTGQLWSHEHGPRGGDELNLIQRGLNYGWPTTSYGMNYNFTPLNAVTTRPGVAPPVTYWTPSIAPSGMTFYTGDRFPRWKNHLFISTLAAQELRRIEIGADGQVREQEIVFKGAGRMRDISTGPDGLLYVLLPDRVARLVPAD